MPASMGAKIYFLNLKISCLGSIIREKHKRDGYGLHQRKGSCSDMGYHTPDGQLPLRRRADQRRTEDRKYVGGSEKRRKTCRWTA